MATLNVRKVIPRIAKRAPRKGSRVAAPSLPYEDWLIEQLKDPGEAAAYLETVIEEGDQASIMLALRQVARAQSGVSEIARTANLTREAAYKILAKFRKSAMRSLTSLLEA